MTPEHDRFAGFHYVSAYARWRPDLGLILECSVIPVVDGAIWRAVSLRVTHVDQRVLTQAFDILCRDLHAHGISVTAPVLTEAECEIAGQTGGEGFRYQRPGPRFLDADAATGNAWETAVHAMIAEAKRRRGTR